MAAAENKIDQADEKLASFCLHLQEMAGLEDEIDQADEKLASFCLHLEALAEAEDEIDQTNEKLAAFCLYLEAMATAGDEIDHADEMLADFCLYLQAMATTAEHGDSAAVITAVKETKSMAAPASDCETAGEAMKKVGKNMLLPELSVKSIVELPLPKPCLQITTSASSSQAVH
uniref:Uncharacterized protein n=1 Tax=Oryza punctata TaxID=4537 RepID=A0A0E0LTY2_ORYPU